MSDGNWIKRYASKLGFLVAATVAISAMVWGWNYGLVQERIYEKEAREAHANYTKNGCNEIAKPKPQVASVKKAESEECTPTEKAQQENDNRRDYADLVAQRSSALWAKIMGIAALIGMGLSLVGVALVWTTFRETRKANEIAIFAQRPWVSIEVSPKIMQQGNGVINFECEMFFNNIGLTVAKNFLFNYEIVFILPDRLDADISQWKKWDNPVHKSKSVLMPGDTSGHPASRSFKMTDIAWFDMGSTSPRVMMPLIAVSAFYQVADGDGWHRTDRAFKIGRRGRDSDCLALEETINRLKPPELTTAPYGHTLAT